MNKGNLKKILSTAAVILILAVGWLLKSLSGDSEETTAVSSGTTEVSTTSYESENTEAESEETTALETAEYEETTDPEADDREETTSAEAASSDETDRLSVTEDGEYSDKDHVALYISTYGHLPSNYITKNEAEDLGWDSSEGNLWEVAPGKSIGGSRFGNYEGLLPDKSGRKYYECDIDYDGGYRNEKRIIYSNDGLVYYTGDHYETFELLYGEE